MKRPIDKIRDGAGQALIGDGAPIVRPIKIGDTLLFATTTSVYRMQLADEIDPARKNINVPFAVQQRVLAYGSDSFFVSSTLLAGAELLNKTYLGQSFSADQALRISLDIAIRLGEIYDAILDLERKQSAVTKDMEAFSGTREKFLLPETQNLQQRGDILNTFWLVAKNCIALTEIFFPKTTPNSHWQSSLEAQILKGLASDHPLRKQLPIIVQAIEKARAHRNAQEHPDSTKSVQIQDYRVDSMLVLHPPCITIQHQKFPVPPVPFLQYLIDTFQQMVNVVELALAWLCNQSAQSTPIWTHHVERLPDDELFNGSPLRWQTIIKAPISSGVAPQSSLP